MQHVLHEERPIRNDRGKSDQRADANAVPASVTFVPLFAKSHFFLSSSCVASISTVDPEKEFRRKGGSL